MPGVQFAAVTSWIPVAGGRDRFAAGFHIEGRPRPDVANISFVTADYFKAMGIPLLRGRHFTTQDNDSSGWFLDGIGRLKPGVTRETARQDLTRIHKALIPVRPVNETTSPRLTPEVERLLGDYRSPIYLVMCAVGVVWLIACGNIAALMLARGLRRSKEISVRMALGAARSRVIRQVLVESLVLSLLSGLLGILFGQAMLKFALRLFPEQVPAWLHFGIDWRIVLFLLVSTVLTALLFGLVPALQMASNVDLQQALQSGTTRATGSAGHRRSLNVLVVAEIALAMVLLVGAGLLLQAFRALQKGDPGFRPENVLTYNLALPGAKYTNSHRVAFFEEHLAKLCSKRSIPTFRCFASKPCPNAFANHFGCGSPIHRFLDFSL